MAIFNITNNKGILPPLNQFNISTLSVNACINEIVPIDQIVYHNGGNRLLEVGDIVYADETLTIPYNTSGFTQEYRILLPFSLDPTYIGLTSTSIYQLIDCR